MNLVVKHGRQNAGNLHQLYRQQIFFGQPRNNDHTNA